MNMFILVCYQALLLYSCSGMVLFYCRLPLPHKFESQWFEALDQMSNLHVTYLTFGAVVAAAQSQP